MFSRIIILILLPTMIYLDFTTNRWYEGFTKKKSVNREIIYEIYTANPLNFQLRGEFSKPIKKLYVMGKTYF